MKKPVLLALVIPFLSACTNDMRNLEKKVDETNKAVKELKDIVARGGVGGGAPQRPARPEPDRAKTYAVPIDGDPFDGPADAKVTLVKAYDYACGFCEQIRDTMDGLRQKYPNDLRIVYKQLVIHPKNAKIGALAFCAAGKQGKHKEMDAMIWDKGFKKKLLDLTDVPIGPPPEKPADGSPAPKPQMVKCWDHPDGCKHVYGYAQELQLDMNKFKADMKGDCEGQVNKDGRELGQFGLSSTPAAFVNGRYISGAVPIDNFIALIEDELKKATGRVAQGTPQAQYYQQWIMDKGLKSLEPPKQ